MDGEYLSDKEFDDYVTDSGSDVYEPDDDDDDQYGGELGGIQDYEVDNLENAINQMQGDFDRIVKSKVQSSGPARGPITGKWTFEFEEEDDTMDFQQELRETSGIGKKRKARRPRNMPELSPQVKDLISKGIEAYTNSSIEEAIPLLREAIRIEPRAVDAWTTLAECHLDLGQEVECLQLRIIATHLREPDVGTWRELGQKSKELGYLQQAIYCFRKILYIDPQDLDALWDWSYLLKMQGEPKKALDGFLKIMKFQHYDPNVLEEIRLLLIDLDDAPRATRLFQDAFDFHTKRQPEGPHSENDFGTRQIIALTDFYNNVNEYEKAIFTIRRGARWLDGRFHESPMWDPVQDDREFDLPGYARDEGISRGPGPGCYPLDINFRQRLAISRLKIGDFGEAQMHASIVLATEDVVEFSILFEELANVYFDLGMYEDAREIYIKLATQNETNSTFIILRIGACDRNLGNYEDAIESYQWALKVDPSLIEAKSKLAEALEIIGRLQDAFDLINEVLEFRRGVPTALPTVEGPSMEDQSSGGAAQMIGSFFDETRKLNTTKSASERNKISREQLRIYEQAKQEQTIAVFERLDQIEEDMLSHLPSAIQIWLNDGGDLVEEFRITRQLFMVDRTSPYRGIIIERRQNRDRGKNKSESGDNEMASRLEMEIAQDAAAGGKQPRGVDNFRGVTFARWLSMITQYCFLLTREDQYALADEVLRHMLLSNAYNDFKNQNTIRITAAICAIRARHYPNVMEHCQKLLRDHQFNNDPFRFLLAGLSKGGLDANEAFIATNFQKMALRELRLWEANARGDPLVLRQNGTRWIAVQGDDALDDDEIPGEEDGSRSKKGKTTEAKSSRGSNSQENFPMPLRPKKMSPLIYAFYGYIMFCARSYQSAKWYLLQAHALQPRDPVICLSLAVACIGRAMQRQADNRHHLVVEAMAFMSEYRKYRRPSQREDEIEYNFGRAFHQLGLYSLSVNHYQRTLKIISKRLEQNPNLTDYGMAREAAYNLSLIFVTNGSPGLAKSLYKQWLSV
ncbi:uncharacterized protein EI90DRAFT_3127081 [Cantharellus anzutake]|uniref:uncharacterized protein n=1 Tax=Cantharellus anzutake TaxID=1750568 RepID=UPI001903BD30|nr:uncharacterized protein EI90DRAFT_3127081 [Cantharellus anzutake]KAF8327415.1 hypothetical protein EI90DRAFT_3127081 [Cantharellus anzutake]